LPTFIKHLTERERGKKIVANSLLNFQFDEIIAKNFSCSSPFYGISFGRGAKLTQKDPARAQVRNVR
jgi:hypothetical protein